MSASDTPAAAARQRLVASLSEREAREVEIESSIQAEYAALRNIHGYEREGLTGKAAAAVQVKRGAKSKVSKTMAATHF